MGRARDRASADLNGQEFILDADADTSISADTDDQIDIKIAGADDFQFTANTFTAQSGSTIAAQALTATTVTASGVVKTDDTTDSTSTTTGSIQTDGGVGIAKDLVVGDDILLKSDGGAIQFGADSEITLTHSADDGLILKHVGTGDGKEPRLTFQAGDNDIAVDDLLGSIEFQAPDEGAGTDSQLVAAAISAVSEGDFSASSNATGLRFATGASETATTKMVIKSTGNVGIGISNPTLYSEHSDDLVVGGSSGNKGIAIIGGDSGYSNISLNRSSNTSTTPNGAVEYNHTDNQMYIKANGSTFLQGNSDGSVLKPKQPCFSKGHSGGSPTTIDTTGHVIVSMGGTEHFDLGNNVDSIGKFTAPVAGRYMFIMTHYIYAINASDDSHMYTYFYVNGSAASLGINQAPLQWYRDGHTANSEMQVQHIGFASLSANDYVQMGFWTSHANIFKHLGSYLSLSGFLVG